MGKILYECHFEFDPMAVILFGVVLGAFLLSLISKKRSRKEDIMSIKRTKIMCWCFILFGIVTGCMLVDMYKKTVIAYQNGDYQIVEGYVENFDPMPHGGHKHESFEIKGVKFEYSDFDIMIGYHNAKSHGGVIRSNGQYFKIGYVHYGNENIIVYIEKYPEKCYTNLEE